MCDVEAENEENNNKKKKTLLQWDVDKNILCLHICPQFYVGRLSLETMKTESFDCL